MYVKTITRVETSSSLSRHSITDARKQCDARSCREVVGYHRKSRTGCSYLSDGLDGAFAIVECPPAVSYHDT